MVGDSDWTESEILDEDRIRHVAARVVNTVTGEVYVHQQETVSNRLQRFEFLLNFKSYYDEICVENPELLNAKVIFFASY